MSPTDTAVRIDPLALDNQICFALAIASRSVISLYRPLLEPLGLTHPQYLVLLTLWEKDNRTLGEIATVLQLDSATLSPLVKRLEALGYISRQRRTSDERVLDIALTERGRELRGAAEKIPPAMVERLDLELSELQALRDSLRGVIAAAQH